MDNIKSLLQLVGRNASEISNFSFTPQELQNEVEEEDFQDEPLLEHKENKKSIKISSFETYVKQETNENYMEATQEY